jgi:hypothetical protein
MSERGDSFLEKGYSGTFVFYKSGKRQQEVIEEETVACEE